ncbi:hypothetical protein AHAS_Ahas12G0210400 [Arachis hypogaea]
MSLVQGQHVGGVLPAIRGGREDDVAACGWTEKESRRGRDESARWGRDDVAEEDWLARANPFSFVVPCTMTLIELQNGLCQSMENDEVSMQNMFQIHRQTQMRQPQIELYVEFETVEAEGIQNDLEVADGRATVYAGMNSDSEEDFEATYEAGNEDEDGDVGVETATENVVVHPSITR